MKIRAMARPAHAFRRSPLAAAIVLALTTTSALADKAISPPGLPSSVDWKLGIDASYGIFGFGNSLYTNPHPDDPSGDLSDNWQEAAVKAGIEGVYQRADTSEIYGKVSAVGVSTFNAPPPLVGGEASSFDIEDLYIGWRSGKSNDLGENALDFTVGRTQYKLGQGMLLWDGASDGSSRGGYWTNPRKAFEFAAIARFK